MIFEGKMDKKGTSTKAFDEVASASLATHLKERDANKFIRITDAIIIKRKKDSAGNPTDDTVHYSEINSAEEFVYIVAGNEVPISSSFYQQIVLMNKCENGDISKCEEVNRATLATHLKELNSDKLIPITTKLVVKKIVFDEVGNEIGRQQVHYSEINKNEQYVCVVDGKDVLISPVFYRHLGMHLRCDDGTFIHKSEVQIPAFKKLHGAKIEAPIHDGDFYVEEEIVVLANGDKVKLPNDRVKQEDDKFLYQLPDGTWQECYYKKGIDTRRFIKQILLDNNKIVDVSKLKQKPNGEYVIKGVDGEDIVVGKKEVELKQPFVEGSTFTTSNEVFIPNNMLKQRPRIEEGNVNLAFVWKERTTEGISRVDVSRNRTKVVITYTDGHKEIYAKPEVVISNLNPGDVEHRIQRFNIVDLGVDGVKIEFLEKKKAIAQNVEFKNGKVESFTINNRDIADIKWGEAGGYSSITQYTIDGLKLSNIEWHAGEIKSCNVHLIDEDGNEVVTEIKDFKNSQYKEYGITYNLTESIRDVKTNGDKFSFKMGDYTFTDAELTTDGKIGKCKVKHGGIEEEIDLNMDPRFEQLKLAVNVSLDESRVIPLIQSQLIEKKDGKYELGADVVQTEEMKNGVAGAAAVEDVTDAVKKQDEFNKNPFTATVVDENGKQHIISDFDTMYEGSANFEQAKDILPDLIGKNKIEVKKGEAEIDSKKVQNAVEDMVVLGFAFCGTGNPVFIVLGIGVLAAGVATMMVAPIIRKNKQKRIMNYGAKKFKDEIQDNVAERCQENINKLVEQYRRELKACKKMYSQAEFEQKKAELREKFKHEYRQEVAKIQILGGGSMRCEFDAKEKVKLTKENQLAYLEYLSKCEELRLGKKPHPDFDKMLKKHNEEMFVDKNAKLLKQIELYEKFGGAKHQKEAFSLKMKNIKFLLEQENEKRASNGVPGLSLKDYKKQLTREFNEGKMVWGGIEDKLEAFQHSTEYLKQDKKTRKELLEAKRKSLEGELLEIKIETVEFQPRLDKNGNPIVEQYTNNLMAYMDHVDARLFEAGETKHIPKFTYDFIEGLTAEQREILTPGTLADATAKVIGKTSGRRMEYDRNQNLKKELSAELRSKDIVSGVEERRTKGFDYVAASDYESIFQQEIELYEMEDQFKIDCDNIQALIDEMPNPELNQDRVKALQDALDDALCKHAKQKKIVQNAKKVLSKQYDEDVRQRALEEFARKHKAQYKLYCKKCREMAGKNALISTKSMISTFFNEMCKDVTKGGSYRKEFETYKVMHHVEDNISAEILCEVYGKEYQEFIEKRNAESTTGKLDPNSEIARCYFYAHCKSEKPLRINNIKKNFVEKTKEKAKKRLKQGSLVKHDEVKIKGRGMSAEATADVAHTNDAAPEVGLTA